MKKNKISLHDHLFKEVYSQPRYCLDIFKLIFSKEEMALFDWTSLRTEATTFIDEEFKEKRMDLLLSSGLKDSKERARILFLLEHKSWNDPELMRQFLKYQVDIYLKTRDPMIPVLVNQSSSRIWKGPLDFQGFLRNFDGRLQRLFKDNVMNFKPRILNIQDLDMEKSVKGLTTHLILHIFKEIRHLDASKMRELFTISRSLGEKDREALVLRAVDYVRRYDPNFTWNIIQEIENQTIKKGEAVMTPLLQSSLDEARMEGMQKGVQKGMQKGVQKGMQKGVQKGRMEGRQEVVSNMLKNHLDTSLICKVTGLSEEEIQKLKKESC